MTTVLETELRVLPEQEKTNLILPFTLPFDAQKLQITYTYAPKILDGAPACEKAEACLCRDVPDVEQFRFLRDFNVGFQCIVSC